ncbi:MAG: exodeoxyribonuclease VII large subunit [Gammaproteobacteria bacterium]
MDETDALFDTAPTLPVLTVSELNRMARRALESQLPLLWVEGEVSNFTRAASGHWYFSLKDANAQVRCVMFRGRNQFADFTPANGDHVEVRALPSLYEARGDFQLGAEQIRRAGAGRLYEAFLKLKARLDAEGLFDPAKKRALPRFPRTLGIVTSPQAAALHDVLTALSRRMPGLPVILYPTPVQGAGAGAQIAAAIRTAGARAECDVLLVCRGGGSLEDLWAFNDEAVARAIAMSPMPVVSGVGHETDFTIADFAADLRCIVVGHALLEKALAPYPAMTGKCLLVDASAFEPDALEAAAIAALATVDTPKALPPLPIQGVPGWDPRNADPAYYADRDVFRPLSPNDRTAA